MLPGIFAAPEEVTRPDTACSGRLACRKTPGAVASHNAGCAGTAEERIIAAKYPAVRHSLFGGPLFAAIGTKGVADEVPMAQEPKPLRCEHVVVKLTENRIEDEERTGIKALVLSTQRLASSVN